MPDHALGATLRLVNPYEAVAHHEIKRAAEHWGLAVYPKVRVADVISLDQVGATGELRRYGLQAHFDFLICRDDYWPAYAIEFDGRYHATPIQRDRDEKKDQLCKLAGLPVLRINSRHLSQDFGRWSLLRWLIDVAEIQLGFDEAQEAGQVPWEEGFDPLTIVSVTSVEGSFPYWISGRPRARLEKLCRAGRVADYVGSGFYGRDDAGAYRGMELVAVTADSGVFVKSAMRSQQFPAPFGELLSEILSVQLVDVVDAWLDGRHKAMPLERLYAQATAMRASLRLGGGHSSGVLTDLWMKDWL